MVFNRALATAFLFGAATVFTLASPLFGQSAQTPVFHGRVDLAVVDVSVIDRDGRPIVGLTPEDFDVRLQGQRQPVRTLDFLRFADDTRVETAAASSAPTVTSNQSADALQASRGGRVIVLLFDDLSFRPADGIGLRGAVERLLPSFGPEDLVGVATTSGLGPVLSPTRDRDALKTMLHSVGLMGRADPQTQYYISIPEATEFVRDPRRAPFAGRECAILDRTTNLNCIEVMEAAARMIYTQAAERAAGQLSAYMAAINALRAAPAPRIVIAFSGGVPLNVARRPGEIDPVSRAATAADVQLFTLTPYVEGEAITDKQIGSPPNDRRTVRRAENEYLIDGAKSVAEAAGGEGFTVIGQADRFISRVLTETSAIYRLGVEVPSSTKESDFLKVKVSVHRDGTTVRVKPLARLPERDAPPVSSEDALKARVAQGGVAFGVPLTIGVALHRESDSERVQVAIEASVPSTAKSPLRAMYAVVDASGHIARSAEATLTLAGRDYHALIGVPLATGDYRLRFAVVDGDGQVGSVDRAISARLHTIGDVLTSDVLLTAIDDQGAQRLIALDNLPSDTVALRAGVEIYPGSGAPRPLRVHLALKRRDDSGTVVAESDVTPTGNATSLLATATLSVAALPAGAYEIVATFLDGARTVGTLSSVFVK